jgi:uroporphyrinogen decarboxylase
MLRKENQLFKKVKEAYDNGRRLIAPLVGFPGCNLTGFSIKVAQQNHSVHYACIKALVEELEPDIAFMLMDLSVEANALGLPVRFPTDESSTVEKHPVERLEQLDKYNRIDILRDSRVQSYVSTIEMMRIGLPCDILVAAYVVGPLTLAGLLRSVQQIAMDSILDPKLLHGLCQFATETIQKYTAALINAGADIICVLEPSAMMLGPEQFREFSGNYTRHIMESYKYENVETVYHVCGNTMHIIKEMASTGVAAISLDSPENGIDMQKAADMVPYDVVVMGNVSPTSVMTDGSVELVRNTTAELLEKTRRYPNFVLATACDIPQDAPLDNMKAFMETGRNFK